MGSSGGELFAEAVALGAQREQAVELRQRLAVFILFIDASGAEV